MDARVHIKYFVDFLHNYAKIIQPLNNIFVKTCIKMGFHVAFNTVNYCFSLSFVVYKKRCRF